MSGTRDIIRALRCGPKTNAELQELTYDHAGSISRYAARLIEMGTVIRIDGSKGRGTKATYALRAGAEA